VSHLGLDGESLLPYVLKDNSKRSNGSDSIMSNSRTFFHHCNSEIFAVRLVVLVKYYLRILTCFICNILELFKHFGYRIWIRTLSINMIHNKSDVIDEV
jgi:hypothetical protein